jgi:autotransporter-associated beta strand protein
VALGGGSTAYMNVGMSNQPGGTVTVQNDMALGDQGTAVLNMVSGGKLTVTGTIYLSRNSATADGTINLNSGGTIVAGYVNNGWGFGHGISNNPNAFNFNGGTLRAYVGSPYFIQPYVNAVVQAGGAIIDDGGYTIDVLAPLVNGGGGGGLTKVGNGTLHLDGQNTYTGTTLVSSGTLGMAPNATIAGPVTVAAGATLAGDIGSIESFYINNSLTLQPGSTTTMTLTPSSNDEIQGLTSVTYGGALVVTNTSGSPLVVGHEYILFNAANPGTGNFSSITILPSGAGTFNPANGVLTITPSGGFTFSSLKASAGSLVMVGSGGTPSSGYTLLSSTNLATPISAWITNTTGTLDASGNLSNSIPLNPAQPAVFFRLRQP